MQSERFVHFFNGKRRICVHLPVALFPRVPGRSRHRRRTIKLGHQAVNRKSHFSTPSMTSASGSSVRTSKIEIIGSERMNRKNRKKNRPIVPTKVATSQMVGQ